MKKRILIVTTHTIENATIEKYYGIVSTNVVVGANFVSDMVASFTDFFGGFSGTYKGKLQLIYKEALDELSEKACLAGANAIVGMKIDFDEITGKGKSMFMVSVVGTAVWVKFAENGPAVVADNRVDEEILNNTLQENRILNDIRRKYLPAEKDWNYLLMNFNEEICIELFPVYMRMMPPSNPDKENLYNYYPQYLSKLDRQKTIDLVYDSLGEDANNKNLNLVGLQKLFSATRILGFIKNQKIALAITLLGYDKPHYDKKDMEQMKEIVEILENQLPDLGKKEVIKGVFSKAEEKYICPNGHKNGVLEEFCNECGLNIKGLTRKQLAEIGAFKIKTETLEKLLNIAE